jgi:hypothetical protein
MQVEVNSIQAGRILVELIIFCTWWSGFIKYVVALGIAVKHQWSTNNIMLLLDLLAGNGHCERLNHYRNIQRCFCWCCGQICQIMVSIGIILTESVIYVVLHAVVRTLSVYFIHSTKEDALWWFFLTLFLFFANTLLSPIPRSLFMYY